MIRTLASALGWLLRLTLVMGVAIWVYLHPGDITINWQGKVIETSVGFAVFVLAILFFIGAVLYHLWRLLLTTPQRWVRFRRVRGMELGYQSLNKGLLAVAAADTVVATKQAHKAERLLPEFALTHLLSAQAAQLRGDDAAADLALAKLAQHPDGQMFGLRGQLTRALARQDRTEALRLARQAHDQQPGQPFLIDTLVQLEARQRNWTQVEKTLRQALSLKAPDHDRWQKDLAAALCALSDEAQTRGDLEAALDCAREAYRLTPDWSPAAIRVAELWQRKAYRKRAQTVLMNAWERAPHPDLLKAWLTVASPERGKDRAELIARLVRANPDHTESALAMAQANLDERLWGVAQQHAQRALELRPDQRSYALLARIAEIESRDVTRGRVWTEKAETAPLAPQWVCRVTQDIFEAWQPLNRRLDFNTIIWAVPENAALAITSTPLEGALAL